MPEEERRAEGRGRRLDGERAWGEKGGAERPPPGRGFSGQDKDASRREDFSAPLSPADPAIRGVCSAFIQGPPSPPPAGVGVGGQGAVAGLGEAEYSRFSARP